MMLIILFIHFSVHRFYNIFISFTSAATANVAENANVGDTVYTAAATDADTFQTLTYTLSATSTVFQLDESSGTGKQFKEIHICNT